MTATDLMINGEDGRTKAEGAKIAIANAKIHLAQSNAHIQINFRFQTFNDKRSININKNSEIENV